MRFGLKDAARLTDGGLPGVCVSVLTQPATPTQTCAVTSPTGTVAAADAAVTVTCTTNKHTVGGTVTGLTTTGLVLEDNAADDKAITASGAFTFATSIASGASYAVTVKTQPSGQTCAVTSGSGTVAGANVAGVAVTCSNTITTVCSKPTPVAFCGGNCSNNHAQYADWWCQLAGFTGATSYTVLTTGSINCLYYNGGATAVLSMCSQVNESTYGLAASCDAVTNLVCH